MKERRPTMSPHLLLCMLLAFPVLLCFSGLVGGTAQEKTTREVFLEGGRWIKKPGWKDGNWALDPEWNAGYAWWKSCIHSDNADVEAELCRKEWRLRKQNGYTLKAMSKVLFTEVNGTQWMRDVHSFRVPCLVEVNDVLLAIADARYISSADFSFIETVAKYSADGGRTWETRVIINNTRMSPYFSRVVDPTIAVKGNNIYILVGRFNTSSRYWTWQHYSEDWDALIYKGTVTRQRVNGKINVSITFEKPQSLRRLFLGLRSVAGKPPSQFLGGVGNTAVTPNGTIVLPIQAKNTWTHVVAKVLYSADDGRTWHFGAGETEIGTTESSVVWWKGRLLLNTRTAYYTGFRKVFEVSNMGDTLTESIESMSRVIGNSPYRDQPGSSGSVISITVEDVDVILTSQPKNLKGSWSRDHLQLWLTDGTRVSLIGQISEKDDNSPYSYLLYTSDDKLFCLYEQKVDEVFTIYLARLVDEMRAIRLTVRRWKAQDALLAGDCHPAGGWVGSCTGIPTAGLAGLLYGPVVADLWRDAYNCVDANVSGASAVPDGVRLVNSKRSRVVWPVGDQGQDQRYYFANAHFTIVTTLNFGVAPEGAASVIGFVVAEHPSEKTLCLSVTRDSWTLTYGHEGGKGFEAIPRAGETHQVALVLESSQVTAYVDGKRIIAPVGVSMSGDSGFLNITHFFIGTPTLSSLPNCTNMTVHNVLLYNRRLDEGELQLLFANRDMIKVADNTTLLSSFTENSVGADGPLLDGSASASAFLTSASDPGYTGGTLESIYALLVITVSASTLFLLTLVFQGSRTELY